LNLAVDNTMLECWKRCLQYGRFWQVDSLRPQRVATALTMGSAIHAGLAAYLNGEPEHEALAKAVCLWIEPDPLDEEWRSQTHLMLATQAGIESLKQWGALPIEVRGKRLVEICAAAPFPITEVTKDAITRAGFDGVTYVGNLDAIVSDQGVTWVVDHKTDSYSFRKGPPPSIDPAFWGRFQLDAGLIGYQWLAQHYVEVAGVIVHGISFPRKLNPSLGIAQLCTAKQTYQFGHLLDSWLVETDHYIYQMAEWMNSPAPPKNTESCFQYGKRCMYYQLCAAGNSEVVENLKTAFRKEEWNPQKRGKE